MLGQIQRGTVSFNSLPALASAPTRAFSSSSAEPTDKSSSSSSESPAPKSEASAASEKETEAKKVIQRQARERVRRRYPCFWTDIGTLFVRAVPGARKLPKPKDPVSKVAFAIGRFGRKVGKNIWGALRDPIVVWEWGKDIWEIIKDGTQWFLTGVKLFRKNVGMCWRLTKRMATGHSLSLRERNLLTKTTADGLRIIPFSFFFIVPFAELALPLVLRAFPNLMPSTFFKAKYDDATLARKFEAKQRMAQFWQGVVAERTKAILEDEKSSSSLIDKASELQAFQEKLMSGRDFPSLQEISRFANIFGEEMRIDSMKPGQLNAMAKMLGLSPMTLPLHNQLQLRHHITSLRHEDRDYIWEGTQDLTKPELIEACKKRAIRFHGVSEVDMRRELDRWLDISRHKKIPTLLLLWIQSFSLTSKETIEGDKPPEHPEPEEFLQVAPEVVEPDPEPKDAFDNMESSFKARLEGAKTRLQELEKEIEEVTNEEKKADEELEKDLDRDMNEVAAASEEEETKRQEEILAANSAKRKEESTATTKPVQEVKAVDKEETAPSKEDKEAILKRLEEVSRAAELDKVIIDRQREMLNHQLEFMSHMRENQPSTQVDAGRILLDQKVRLVEMMNSFKNDLKEIEALLNEQDELEAGEMLDDDREYPEWIDSLFDRLDKNKDGRISRKEFVDLQKEMAGMTSPGRDSADIANELKETSGIQEPAKKSSYAEAP